MVRLNMKFQKMNKCDNKRAVFKNIIYFKTVRNVFYVVFML